MRKFLFAVAVLAISGNPAPAQSPSNKPANPPPVIVNDGLKPTVVTLPSDLKLPPEKALRIGGPCTFVGGQSFPTDVQFGAETIVATCELAGPVTVNDLKEIPKGTTVLKGTKLTLAPGEKLPVPPAPPAKPKMYLVDGVLYPEPIFDKKYTDDAGFRLKVAKYTLGKVAETGKRLEALEVQVKDIKDKLTPKEQSQALGGRPSGRLCWSTCGDFTVISGCPVRNEGWDRSRGMYCYQYMH